MPPQTPATPPQIPGSDVLLDTLRQSHITDEQRQQIWDAYHVPGGKDEFLNAIRKLPVPDQIRQDLWDMRFKGFNGFVKPPNQQAPSATAPAPQAGGAVSVPVPGPASHVLPSNMPSGSYQKIKGGPVVNINQTPNNIAIQAIEKTLGVTNPDALQDLPHPYLGAMAQAMTSGAKLMEQTARDPLTLPSALASGFEQAGRAVYAGLGSPDLRTIGGYLIGLDPRTPKPTDPRQLAAATGQVTGLLFDTEAFRRAGKAGVDIVSPNSKGPSGGGTVDPFAMGGSPGKGRSVRGAATIDLMNKGFSGTEIEQMTLEELGAASRGELKPGFKTGTSSAPPPEVPRPARTGVPSGDTVSTRPTEAVPGGKASATNQAASVPATAQRVADIVPAPPPRPTAGPVGDIRPPAQTTATPGQNWTSTLLPSWGSSQVSTHVPPTASPARDAQTGAIVQPSVPARGSSASAVTGRNGQPQEPLTPTQQNGPLAGMEPYSPVNPQEIVDLQRQLESQGWKGTVTADNIHSILREANDLRAVVAPRPDDVGAIREEHRAALEQPGYTSSPRGTTVGLPAREPAPPVPITPATTAEVPKPIPPKKSELEGMTPEQLNLLHMEHIAQAERAEQQAQAIREIMVGHPLAEAMRRDMQGPKEGGAGEVVGIPNVPGSRPQFTKAKGKPVRIVGTQKAEVRRAYHDALADEMSLQFDEVNLAARARARDAGLNPDLVHPEGYEKTPHEEYLAMREEAKQEQREIQDDITNELKAAFKARLEEARAGKNRDLQEEEIKQIHDAILKQILERKDENGKNVVERLNDLKKIVGRDPQRPFYRKKGVPVVTPEGVVKSPAPVPHKTVELARRIWGKQLEKIPSDKEWEAKAQEHEEKGKLQRAMAAAVKNFLDVKVPKGKEAQAGAIGEAPMARLARLANATREVPRTIPSVKDIVERAKKAGYAARAVNVDDPSGSDPAWLSPKGDYMIPIRRTGGARNLHTTVSEELLPEYGVGTSYAVMMENGWVRKAGPQEFDVHKLDEQTTNTIEMDQIRNRMTDKPLWIDVGKSRQGIEVPGGYTDLASAILKARNLEANRMRENLSRMRERGIGGTLTTAGMALGGVAGAVAGHIMGGVHGMMVGGTVGMSLGFMGPVLLTSRPVQVAMQTMANIVRNAGISIKTWLQGTPQASVQGIDPEMDRIMNEQRMHRERHTTWAERIAQFPSDLYRLVDPAALVADKNNMSYTGRMLTALDKRGRVWRDMTLPDTQSLYLAVWNAHDEALGLRAAQGMQYRDIKIDAAKAKATEFLRMYLNLAAYKRANLVANEHLQELTGEAQRLQQQLQNPNNSYQLQAQLQQELRQVQKMATQLQNKINAGEINPGGFNPAKVQAVLTALEQRNPQLFVFVENLANRAFQVRRPILNLLLDNGIISQEAYNTYTARGDAYVPMRRIMDDLERTPPFPQANPLYLKHQSVIRMLEGSQRTNIDPLDAFTEDDRRAFNNLIRNGVIKKALQLAHQLAQTIGPEFTPVTQDYQAKSGEAIVGHYENGKPQFYATPKYLGEVLNRQPLAAEVGFSILAKGMANFFKKAATVATISWLGRSSISHMLAGAVQAEKGGLQLRLNMPKEVLSFIKDWTRAAIEVYRDGPWFQELVRGGAAFGGFESLFAPENTTSPDEVGFKGHVAKVQLLEAASDLSKAWENSLRTNILMRAMRNGATLKAALLEAKQYGGAPFFARMGEGSSQLNRWLMFLTARAAYPYQAMRSMAKHPGRILTFLAMMSAMSMVNTAVNLQYHDANGNATYRKVSQFEKERNWVMLTPFTYRAASGARMPWFVKVPKLYLAQMFINPIEETMTRLMGKDVRSGRQFAIDRVEALAPIALKVQEGNAARTATASVISSLNPVFKVGAQQVANVDDFGRPIVPPKQEGIVPEYQMNAYTSPTVARMGQGGMPGAKAGAALGATLGGTMGPVGAVFGGAAGAAIGASGQSPRRIEQGVRGIAAGAGAQAESVLDPFFGGKERHLEGAERLTHLPVVGQIASIFVGGSRDAEFEELSEQFYNTFNRAQEIMNTFNYLISQGKAAEAARWSAAHKNELHKAIVLGALKDVVQTLNERITQLQNKGKAQTEDDRKTLEIDYERRLNLLRKAKAMLEAPETKASDTGPMGNQVSNTSPSK
jgi:Large polyvalent protein associated domain 38